MLKLYLNDAGLLSNILYKTNIKAILNDEKSINLGTVYESVVASELKAHGHNFFYYDNKANGEVDFLIDDYDTLSFLPLEIKSGKNYVYIDENDRNKKFNLIRKFFIPIYSAINKFLSNKSYNVKQGIVL